MMSMIYTIKNFGQTFEAYYHKSKPVEIIFEDNSTLTGIIDSTHKEQINLFLNLRTNQTEKYKHFIAGKKKNVPWKEIFEILETTEETSFCALGKSVSIPINSYYKNVFKKQ